MHKIAREMPQRHVLNIPANLMHAVAGKSPFRFLRPPMQGDSRIVDE